MKAIVYHKYRTPDVLELKETNKPVPYDNEVLIKVHAASINDWDRGLLHGDLINCILNGLWKPKRKIPGSGIAGRRIWVVASPSFILLRSKNLNLFYYLY